MEDSTTVVALRDIRAGEEVTIDYGTVNSGALQEGCDNFACRCVYVWWFCVGLLDTWLGQSSLS